MTTANMTKRFELLLVRHGVTDWNEDGRLMGRSAVELNPRGRAEAARVAEMLEGVSIDAVTASPQVRTQQTAGPIASSHGLDILTEPDFDEVWLSEAWKGKTVAELRGDPELERVIADPTYRSTAIEPIADVQKRAVAGVERLRTAESAGRVVVVSHGDPLRALIAHYLGLDLNVFRRLACDNGSLSLLRFNRRGARLELLNWLPQPGSGKPHVLASS